jgi:hypothetical protein
LRTYTEPTARNLLRAPLVLGVSTTGLWILSSVVLLMSILAGTSLKGNAVTLGTGLIGYACLKFLSLIAKDGWEESAIFLVERILSRSNGLPIRIRSRPSDFKSTAPDTLEPDDELVQKMEVQARLLTLRSGESITVHCQFRARGARISELSVEGAFSHRDSPTPYQLVGGEVRPTDNVHTLYRLPVTTDPRWLSDLCSSLPLPTQAFIRLRALDPYSVKRQVELSRRRNARGSEAIANIDSDVTFEESSRVLQGLSRGEERLFELSLILTSQQPLDLDPSLFLKETSPLLPLVSILGLRQRAHRPHTVRAVTAADLIPTLLDPEEDGLSVLKTRRELPLYFSPQDPRLEALHWLVIGASGSGKSFFTGAVLRRTLRAGMSASVLFVDHNRSFRRVVRADQGSYLEPETLSYLEATFPSLLQELNRAGSVAGIELSDLVNGEKRGAAQFILSEVEAYLRRRGSTHPFYVVLDECWNFLRDEPVLVQRAFREFRKLNGAAVAITQSLSDFLSDESGRSILQNAPIRLILRQGEDLAPYQAALGLNRTELTKVRFLRQSKGEFGEVLIKTPYLSRIGRLYPTQEEHDLLRTDNIREELIAERSRRDAQ